MKSIVLLMNGKKLSTPNAKGSREFVDWELQVRQKNKVKEGEK